MIDQATQIAINSPIESYANQFAAEAALASGIIARGNAEDAFLYGKYGEYLNLQRATEMTKETVGHWHFGGNVGNNPGEIGAGHPTVTYTFTPGDTAVLTAKGSLLGQANLYYYMPLAMPVPTSLPRRIVDVRTFQIVYLKPWRALEWQSQIIRAGKIHNCAIQLEVLNKTVNYFIYGDTWHPFPQQPAFPDLTKPVQIYTEFALDEKSTTHVAITINGVRYPLGVTNPVFNKTAGDKATCAIQIDPFKDGNCSLQISDCSLRLI